MSEQDERSALVALSQAQIEALIELIEGEQEIRIKASTNKGSKLPVEVLGKAWNQLRIALYALHQQEEVPEEGLQQRIKELEAEVKRLGEIIDEERGYPEPEVPPA